MQKFIHYLANMKYMFTFSWKISKSNFVIAILYIVLDVAEPLALLIFPALVIDELVYGKSWIDVVKYIVLLICTLFITKVIRTISDMYYKFTNATLIYEAFANEMLRVKNFIPAISVQGFEEATDFRRGDGTFKKVEKAMSILKSKRLPFGVSRCYTSKNTDVIGSEEYFDKMIEWGAKFCWLFTYMPVGQAAVSELMVTAEQRKFMYEQVRKFRETKPIFALDFWNDGEYTGDERVSGGCIAGGRRYIHINANGDMEPCAFIHYSDSNIREKTLLEALQSPLFMAYHNG